MITIMYIVLLSQRPHHMLFHCILNDKIGYTKLYGECYEPTPTLGDVFVPDH